MSATSSLVLKLSDAIQPRASSNVRDYPELGMHPEKDNNRVGDHFVFGFIELYQEQKIRLVRNWQDCLLFRGKGLMSVSNWQNCLLSFGNCHSLLCSVFLKLE